LQGPRADTMAATPRPLATLRDSRHVIAPPLPPSKNGVTIPDNRPVCVSHRGPTEANSHPWDDKSPWQASYSSFGGQGPYPLLNRSPIDRGPLAARSIVTRTGLVARPTAVASYPIGMRLQQVHSDFGVEDESKDWLHKPLYGRVPPYLARMKATVAAEHQQQLPLQGSSSRVLSPRHLPPLGSPRAPHLSGSTVSTSSSPRLVQSPRAYPTAYGLSEAFGGHRIGLKQASSGASSARASASFIKPASHLAMA